MAMGQTLTTCRKNLYGVYWDQYQGFKAPARGVLAKRVISKSRSTLKNIFLTMYA
jgi:hypothetical protein